jgi:hypothetical protein
MDPRGERFVFSPMLSQKVRSILSAFQQKLRQTGMAVFCVQPLPGIIVVSGIMNAAEEKSSPRASGAR